MNMNGCSHFEANGWQLNRWWLLTSPCQTLPAWGSPCGWVSPLQFDFPSGSLHRKAAKCNPHEEGITLRPQPLSLRSEAGLTHRVGREPEGNNPSSRCHANSAVKYKGVARRWCCCWHGSLTPTGHARRWGLAALRFPAPNLQPIPYVGLER